MVGVPKGDTRSLDYGICRGPSIITIICWGDYWWVRGAI